jgi:hypothetical protein
VSDRVLRLAFDQLKTEFTGDLQPNIYVVPPDAKNIYVGYEPLIDKSDPLNPKHLPSTELKRYEMVEVIKHVQKVFDPSIQFDKSSYNGTEPKSIRVAPYIDAQTNVVIAPDHWDRKLPLRFASYAKNLDVLPFSVVLHAGVADVKQFRKLVPPKRALEMMREDSTIKALYAADLLVNTSVGGRRKKSSHGLAIEDSLDIAPDLRGFEWKMNAKNKKKRRPSKKKKKVKKSTKKKKKKKSTKKKKKRSTKKKPKKKKKTTKKNKSRSKKTSTKKVSRRKKSVTKQKTPKRSRSRASRELMKRFAALRAQYD